MEATEDCGRWVATVERTESVSSRNDGVGARTRILIYCNNNFLNAPDTFPPKAAAASLNIHTFNTLYNYGCTNLYELGPLIDIRKAKLKFEGTQSGAGVNSRGGP